MTYAEEKRQKDAAKARKAKKYRFNPVLFDVLNPPANPLSEGDIVVKIQPHGCPRNGTMNMCYVGHPETGEFIGMASLNSLEPA